MKNVTQFVIVTLFALSLAACGEPLEAASEPLLEQVDVAPTLADADSETHAAEPTAPTQNVSCDKDGDGYCPTNALGKVVDCNDNIGDENGDGIIDGKQFAPGLSDICDGLDNDCDNVTDEDTAVLALYQDLDGDGYGAGSRVVTCTTKGFSNKTGDCAEKNPDIHPGAEDKAGDGIDADCDDEIEVSLTSVPATLAVTTDSEIKLSLSYQVFSKWEDLGDWWDLENISEPWAKAISAELEVPENTCGLRFNVTFGGGSFETWACVGNGETAAVSDLVSSVLFDFGVGSYDLDDVQIWSEPSGQGCSLLVRWKTDGECAKPTP